MAHSFFERHSNRRITLLIAAILALLLFLFGDLFLGQQPVCLYHAVLGVPCPFCGITRSVYAFMHMQFAEAWAYNPLIFGLFVWYILEIVDCIGLLPHWGNTIIIGFRWLSLFLFVALLVLRWFKYFPLP
jgi:hypothetical protein